MIDTTLPKRFRLQFLATGGAVIQYDTHGTVFAAFTTPSDMLTYLADAFGLEPMYGGFRKKFAPPANALPLIEEGTVNG